ncbi:MAG: YkgJ family cysteine cluster protein [Lachnospiraceae bacterium]
MQEITKYYKEHDMVRIACNDCKGCSSCCVDMGDSVRITPFDMYQLLNHYECTFQELLGSFIQISVVEGMILPSMNMAEGTNRCKALTADGRCSIHEIRPSICRLFPLGRQYYSDHIEYFILEGACPQKVKTKVKIDKWIQTKNLTTQEQFLVTWHAFEKEVRAKLVTADEEYAKQLQMYVLQLFFVKKYTADDFYTEFLDRIAEARDVIE